MKWGLSILALCALLAATAPEGGAAEQGGGVHLREVDGLSPPFVPADHKGLGDVVANRLYPALLLRPL